LSWLVSAFVGTAHAEEFRRPLAASIEAAFPKGAIFEDEFRLLHHEAM
jgi:hypothetical protein